MNPFTGSPPKAESSSPTITVVIGPLRITGAAAAGVLLLIVAIAAVLIIRARPSLSNWPIWVSAALWIGFTGYWGRAAGNSAAASSSESAASRRVQTRLLLASYILLFIPIPGMTFQLYPRNVVPGILGLTLQAGFLLLALSARRHLGRYWSGNVRISPDHRLVRAGPYRLIRHPIYTAMLGMFTGSAVVSGSVHAVLAVLVVSVAYWRKIRLEERYLAGHFGDEWTAYRRDSWALIPWLV